MTHRLRDLAHTIVVRSIANIEYFIVNRFGRSLQHRDNRSCDVQPRLATGVGSQLVSSPCYGAVRGPIVSEPVAALATSEYSLGFLAAFIARTR